MRSIDLTKVPENPDSFSRLTPRSKVEIAMNLDSEINHIEDDHAAAIVIEMGSGAWLRIPKDALITVA